MTTVDLMYLAWNRLDFTRETFIALLKNTNWNLVNQLFVYDDGSQDGTRQWLEGMLDRLPGRARLVPTQFHSPVTAMVHFIEHAGAPILAKVDNDAMMPPYWLDQSLDVLKRHPELTLLGIEALYPHIDDPELPRDYMPAEFISGLGLYKRAAFAHSRPAAFQRYFGLEEWQMAQPSLKRGWISPAIPVFLLDRFPLDPWRRLSDEYIRLGWQRPWQNYPPECTLWHWRWPPGTEILPASMDNLPDPIPSELQSASPGVSPEFLGALRIKNEAAHIRQVIESILPLCQLIYILDDHSTDNTLEICRSFGEKVIVIPSPFEGLDEARDKNFLLSKIFPTGADWVLWIDGDEVLERNGPARLKQAVNAHPQAASFGLKIVYFWNDEQHVRVDGVYGRFWRQSLFRLKGQPASALSFQPTGYGGNFHCGNIPAGLTGRSLNLDVRLKHYGYVSREQRMAKYDWYRKMDPNNQLEDEYRHLAEIPGAKHAPGPSVLKEWRE